MTFLKILTIIFIIFAASRAYLRFKGKTLSFSNLIFWSMIWLATLVFVFDPQSSDMIARLFGLQRGTDTIFFLANILLFYLIFRLYIRLDMTDKDLTKLVIELSKKDSKSLQENKEVSQ